MEYSMEAVANKMIVVIVALSAVLSFVGFLLFSAMAGNADAVLFATLMGVSASGLQTTDAIPFAVGIAFAMLINIIKVVLMKRAVGNAVNREAETAKYYLKGQYFIRLVITGVILLVAGWLHANMQNEAGSPLYVNFMGAFYGIFAFPVAIYSMRFFFRNALKDNPSEFIDYSGESANEVQDAINKLKTIGAEDDVDLDEADK
ncbi:MAG: hypothetical protein FWF81_05365 [Defluviitaleaceae bacterium]|nr:hypothetical protein [Defluviitaleaceae bacterium]